MDSRKNGGCWTAWVPKNATELQDMCVRNNIDPPRHGCRVHCRRYRDKYIEKNTAGIILSYYETFNDEVFDLFEPLEKRSIAGLPVRDKANKAVIVGLTVKKLYDWFIMWCRILMLFRIYLGRKLFECGGVLSY